MPKLNITKKFLAATLLLSIENTSIWSMDQPIEEQAAISLSKAGVKSSSNLPITIKSGGIAGIREARMAIERLLLDPTEKEKIEIALQAYAGDPITVLNSYNTINTKLAELEKPGGLKTGSGMMQLGTGTGGIGNGTGVGTATGGTTVDIDTLLAEMEEMGVGEVKTLYTETIKKQSKVLPDTSSWKRTQFIEAIKELYQPSEKKAIEDAQKQYDKAKNALNELTEKLMAGGTDKENDFWSIEADKLISQMEELEKIINAEELKKKEEEEKAEQHKKDEEVNALKQAQIEARKLQKDQEALKDKQDFDGFVSDLTTLPPLTPELMTFFIEKDDLKTIEKLKNAKTTGIIAAEIEKITNLTVLSALRSRLSYYTENAEDLLKKIDLKITEAGINNVKRELGPINLAIENTIAKVSGPIIKTPVISQLPIEPKYEDAYADFQKFWKSIKADNSNSVFKSLEVIRSRTGTASDAIKCAIEEETILAGKNANLRKVDIEGDTWKEYTPLEVKAIIGSLKKMLPPIQLQDTIYIIKYLKEISEQLEKDSTKMSPKTQARYQAQKSFLSVGALNNPGVPMLPMPRGGALRGGPMPRGGPMLRGGPMPRGGPLPMAPKTTPVFKAPTLPVVPWTVVPLTLGTEESDIEQELITNKGINGDVANEAGNAIIGKPTKLAKLNAVLKVLGNRNAIDTTKMQESLEYRNIINSKLR